MSPSFPFDFEGEMSDLIVSITDHCLSFTSHLKRLFFFSFWLCYKGLRFTGI